MIFIDLRNKYPTDNNPSWPSWTPWTQEKWQAWLDKSKQLKAQLAALDQAGDRAARNKLIEDNSDHWVALKDWLVALSSGKCWFSEAKELYSHYDVEHFRPKKAAKELDGTERDGYWWLAFDYMNFRLCGNVGNRKKGGWFPLRNGSLRSSYTNPCEESEACYLLDPANAADVNLLGFDEEGKAISAPDNSDWNKERVNETIKRLKLNEHPALADARRKVWQRVSALIANFREKAQYINYNPAAQAEVKLALVEIQTSIQREAELSGVARYCVLLNCPKLLRLA